MVHANEVSPDRNASTNLAVGSATALRFADRGSTDRFSTGLVSPADRCTLYFDRSGILGRGVFQLQISRDAHSTRGETDPTGFIRTLSNYPESDVSWTSTHFHRVLFGCRIPLVRYSAGHFFLAY